MAEAVVPIQWPAAFVAGDTVNVSRSFQGYRSTDGWTLKVYLAGARVANATGTPQADGTWLITLSADTTSNLTPGTYQLLERVSNNAGEVYSVSSSTLQVVADPASATPGSLQTHEEKTLSVIEAALSGRLGADIEHYSIAGRSVSKIPIRELKELHGVYKAAVWRQKNPGMMGGPAMAVQFTPEDMAKYPPTWADIVGG